MKAVFFEIQSLEEIHALKLKLAYLEMFLEVGNARIPRKPHQSYQIGSEKAFASQWLSTSPNSMISFKFYVKTLFFNIVITLHLGKGQMKTVNRYSGPDSVYYAQFIYWSGL